MNKVKKKIKNNVLGVRMTLRIHVWLKRDYKIVMNKIIIACLAFASSYGFIQVIDPF